MLSVSSFGIVMVMPLAMWDQMGKVKETQDGLGKNLQLTGIPAESFEVNARNSERIKHD